MWSDDSKLAMMGVMLGVSLQTTNAAAAMEAEKHQGEVNAPATATAAFR